MKTVLILCGGESGEHEVSLQSANSIVENISKDLFDFILVAITKDGRWVSSPDLIRNPSDPKNIHLDSAAVEVSLRNKSLNGKSIDVVFSVIHGAYGEDGCLQGFFELNHLPFVGSGVVGSAVGMDKDIMKRLLSQREIQVAPWLTVRECEEFPSYESVVEKLGSPFFIKPSSAGSSLGVSKCKAKEDFEPALKDAFQYDNKLLLEEYIQGRELEIAVLGNATLEASCVGEVLPAEEYYSYEAKYILENSVTEIPAAVSDEVVSRMQDLSKIAFRILECSGLARVDFFLKDNELYLNEINTLPGFTKISMYPKLFEQSGISYTNLITRLIQLAFESFEKTSRLKREYVPRS